MSFSSDGRGLDVSSAPASAERPKLKIKPLTRLLPYISRYRGRAFAALTALVIAALTTLVVPVAVRRMIDFGFSDKAVKLTRGPSVMTANGLIFNNVTREVQLLGNVRGTIITGPPASPAK